MRQPNEEQQIAGWGRIAVPGMERFTEDLERASEHASLFRGLGRSYGDAALPAPGQLEVLATPHADRILSFDPASGLLRAEAGLSLREINRLFLPRGWFTPVTPGTHFVTLGGMVAADVHGKNHHRAGCFGEHVTMLRMRLADGRTIECSPMVEPDLFFATIGGMGLTGHILEVEVPLVPVKSRWIESESERIPGIDQFIQALKEAGPEWPFTVGWIDCLSRGRSMGRGILIRGRWADRSRAPARAPRPRRRLSVPFVCPSWLLSRWSAMAFNAVYYHSHLPRIRRRMVSYESFFYPLDRIEHWNRLYGKNGFTQFQCVLPDAADVGAARNFLERLTALGGASFLCVIKDCGEAGRGLLSFPRRGISIALDIPVKRDTQALVDALNEKVLELGGRIYLAKDSFTRPEHFARMEPRLEKFLEIRRRYDPEGKFRSALSVRLFGDSS